MSIQRGFQFVIIKKAKLSLGIANKVEHAMRNGCKKSVTLLFITIT